jgi:polygalacturonase
MTLKSILLNQSGFFFALTLLLGCNRSSTTYNILDFAARGDARTMNTNAINKAIINCNKNGGGTVWIPRGTYISGTLVLLSNVNLHLDPVAVLLGSRHTSDYL